MLRELDSRCAYGDLKRCFPRADAFAELSRTPAPDAVRDSACGVRPFDFSERHLQCVWFDPALRPRRLLTDEGEEVTVESAGSWNLEAGPDFLDAALLVGPDRRRLRGDVEIHVHPQDWLRHGHANDARYARVIAHVFFRGRATPAGAAAGPPVRIALGPALAADGGFSFENIDVAAYPFSAASTPVPCANAIRHWDGAARAGLLTAAGEERMRLKALRLRRAIDEAGPDQAFYTAAMAALGYKQNQAAFRALAAIVPVERLRDEAGGDPVRAYALLLGAGGLLPTPRRAFDGETRLFVRQVWDHWWKLRARWQSDALAAKAWVLGGLRPQNHPLRRLAAAAALFARPEPLHAVLEALDSVPARAWFREAAGQIAGKSEFDYWRRRLALGGAVQSRPVALLGARRIAALLANVVVPWLAARGRDVSGLLDALPPEDNNRLVRQTAFDLLGRDHNPAIYARGLAQQGLLQIFHDFCVRRQGGCDGCRLARALDSRGTYGAGGAPSASVSAGS